MRKFLIALVAGLFLAGPALAVDVNTTGLSNAQKAQLQVQIEQMKQEGNQRETVEQLAEYAELGEKYGAALAATASRLGQSVDDIMGTTVGKVAMVLIVWKIAGKEILGVIVGSLWLIAFVPTWIYFFRRMCVIRSISYGEETGNTGILGRVFGRREKQITFYRPEDVDGTRFFMAIGLAIGCAVGFMIILH